LELWKIFRSAVAARFGYRAAFLLNQRMESNMKFAIGLRSAAAVHLVTNLFVMEVMSWWGLMMGCLTRSFFLSESEFTEFENFQN